MCLTHLSENVYWKFKNKKFGYKVFSKEDGELYGDCFSVGKARPEEKWINEKDYRGKDGRAKVYECFFSYTSGWHIFLTREAARDWASGLFDCRYVVRKVLFKNPVAWGKQEKYPVVVAKDMRIINGKT